jgi:thiamine biosynthesis lipoprotein
VDDGSPIVRLGLDAMRTRFEIVLAGGDERRLRDAGEAALAEIDEAEARLSLFRRDSLLAHINRAAAHEVVRVDGETFGLLRLCREVWALSDGAFDPTVAGDMTRLGLHEGAAIAQAGVLGRGFDAVTLDEAACGVRFTRAVALDLGGVAKGHALDLAGRVVREAGVEAALLHGGTSSVVAIGAPPGRAGWEVGIRGTEGREAGSMPRVVLRDRALGVSAHRGRRAGGVTHVLDPRTGEPAGRSCEVAAVTARTGAMADAWSTAGLVAGGRPRLMPDGVEWVAL